MERKMTGTEVKRTGQKRGGNKTREQGVERGRERRKE